MPVSCHSTRPRKTDDAVMGCVASKDPGDSAPNFYRVWNVDREGRVLWPGYLELTDVELILHRRDGQKIHWPTRWLRRYGSDSEVFSFESGRRCPTGQGVYAFKCSRADELFNRLQEHVLAHGQDELSHNGSSVVRSSSVSENGRQDSEGALTIHAHYGTLRPVSFNNGLLTSTPSPLSGDEERSAVCPRAPTPRHDYVNSTAVEAETNNLRNGSTQDDNYAKLDDLLKQERLYINVKPEERLMTNYTNWHQMPVRTMNYAVLDLEKEKIGGGGSEASGTTPTSPLSLTSLPESPERVTEGYAVIDFERTAALSNTNNVPSNGVDQSLRKTRHNSTISDFILSRHNSAVSD